MSARATGPAENGQLATARRAGISALETTELGSFVWRLESGFRESLEGDVVALLADRARAGAELLKRTRVREVWQFERDPGFFVKRYLCPTNLMGIRARLRGSKAKREADAAVALAARGFTTAIPLAVGERRGPGLALESVLVTRAVDHRGDLTATLTGTSSSVASRRRLLAGIGAYLAQLHAAGVHHSDLHGENLLVLDSPETAFALIDLDGVSIGRPLSKRRRMASLARTLHALRQATSRTDRLRALRSYLDSAGIPLSEHASFRLGVERGWRRERRRALRSGTRRALRIGSRFDHAHSADRNLYWRRSFGREIAERVLEAHAESVRTGRGTFLKQSRRVRVTLQDVGAEKRFVVKETFDKRLWIHLRNTLLGPRARVAWVAGHGLDFRGLTTATTVALEERKRGGLIRGSTIVTVALDGMAPLSRHFEKRFRSGPLTRDRIREKRQLLRLVAETVRQLHAERIHHHDLSARNLFVAETGSSGELAILDLESVRSRPLTRRRRAVNLCQVLETVGATHWTDARRFLRHYGIRDPIARETWLRRIDALSRARRVRRATRRSQRQQRDTAVHRT